MMFWMLISQAFVQQQVFNPNISVLGAMAYVQKMGFQTTAEVALQNVADPYFELWAIVAFEGVHGEHHGEPGEEHGGEVAGTLEELYARTLGGFHGFSLQVGRFRARAGRFNERHPHTWAFITPSEPFEHFFGEGLARSGVRVDDVPALPFYLHLTGEWLEHNTLTLTARTSADIRNLTVLGGLSWVGDTASPLQDLFLPHLTFRYMLDAYRYVHLDAEGYIHDGAWEDGVVQVLLRTSRRIRLGVRSTLQNPVVSGLAELSFSEFSRLRAQVDVDSETKDTVFRIQLDVNMGAHGAHPF